MICFALCAHEGEWNLRNQIRNIRKYNPQNSFIVFYNGGKNPDFGKQVCREENVRYCSYSRPLTQRTSGRFFYDVMRWLEDQKIHYEYLVYMEYDIMFVNSGFRRLLDKQMKKKDVMVKMMKKETDPRKTDWDPGKAMWRDWKRWGTFFRSNHYYRTSSPVSVFRHRIVKRMLAGLNKNRLEELFRTSKIPCIGEMVFITLAKKKGAKCTLYPKRNIRFLRFRPAIMLKEVKAAKSHRDTMFIHPVKDASVRHYIYKNV